MKLFKRINTQPIKRNLNLLLLFLTGFLIFAVPVFPITWHKILYNISFTAVFVNAVLVVEYNRKFNIGFAAITILVDLIAFIFDLSVVTALSTVFRILFYFYLSAMFIRQIASSKIVDIKVITESIIGYLMLGIAFGLMIVLLMAFNQNSFTFPDNAITLHEQLSGLSTFIYASIVTLSTLGYGDILPTTPTARSLVTFITVCGQFYMAIIVALLIGKFASK